MIRLSKASLDTTEKQALAGVIDGCYLGMGTYVGDFEREISNYVGGGVEVSCVNSGTGALHLALQAAGVGPGDDVLVPSLTYVASYQAISATGARPVSCDISLSDGCLLVGELSTKLTPNTRAIMHVHYASNLGEREEMLMFAKEKGLRFIEDAAHSFGSSLPSGKKVGSDGDITCFSFDGIKNITCGEGGAIVSHDKEIIASVNDARLLGVEKDSDKRLSNMRSWDFDVSQQGWRYHMSNLNAAIGLQQLKKLPEFSEKRRLLASLYAELLQPLPVNIIFSGEVGLVPHIFPITVSSEERDALRAYLSEKNIQTGLHYKPNHLLSRYKSDGCSNAEKFYLTALTLPLHVELNNKELNYIVNSMANFFGEERSVT